MRASIRVRKRNHRWSLHGTYGHTFAQAALVFGYDLDPASRNC